MMQDPPQPADLSDRAFHRVAQFAYANAGLTLVPEKRRMVQSRLRHRLKALQLSDFDSYLDWLDTDEGAVEKRHLISALTTNVSQFFREPHHFDILLEHGLPQARQELSQGTPCRFWSAGCSNGQEALTLAMFLLDKDPSLAHQDVKILATDIDPKVIAFARQGLYPRRMLDGLPKGHLDKYFTPTDDARSTFSPTPVLRKLISYRELNLLGSWPMRRAFDAIFCRNVVIYFDALTQDGLWPRFDASLKAGGLLFLGHSERISDPAQFDYSVVGPTAYQKPSAIVQRSAHLEAEHGIA